MQNNQFKHRIVKIQLQNNQWRSYWNLNNDKFNNIYNKFKPKNSYISVSQWLNPKDLENGLSKPIIVASDILFDFDNPSKENVLKAQEYMKNYEDGYYLYQVVKSSTYGLHLIYKIRNKPKIPDPNKRLEFYKNEKVRIADKVKDFGVDMPVLKDIYRIRRIPNTINGNKECLCYECSLTLGIVGIENKYKIKREIEKSPLIYTYKFISNKIKKDKYYIHIKVKNLNQLENITKKYNIKYTYIFKSGKMYELVSKTIVDYNRLLKILKYCNASNLRTFEKYKQSWIRISSLLKITENEVIEVSEKPEIDKEMLENGVNGVKIAVKIKD